MSPRRRPRVARLQLVALRVLLAVQSVAAVAVDAVDRVQVARRPVAHQARNGTCKKRKGPLRNAAALCVFDLR